MIFLLIEQIFTCDKWQYRKVVIECDGHNFHEKTKEQSQYDKQRDRFIQSQGYNVLRFTGSEIHKDPFKCVSEVIEYFKNAQPYFIKYTDYYLECNPDLKGVN